jgi:hypothetical protein
MIGYSHEFGTPKMEESLLGLRQARDRMTDSKPAAGGEPWIDSGKAIMQVIALLAVGISTKRTICKYKELSR